MGVATLPNVPRPDQDWYGDYEAYLVGTQNSATSPADGSWTFSFSCWGYTVNGVTALAEVILSPTALVLPDKVTLGPATATNPVGTNHTVTATATSQGNPVVGVNINFSVTAGPNAGKSG